MFSSEEVVEVVMVTTSQKRKRSSLDSAIAEGNEEDIQDNVKSSKKESKKEVLSTEVSVTIAAVTYNVSADSEESRKGAPESHDELSPNLNKGITSTAHKQILQQQWTAEAHGHTLRTNPAEWADESIGTEIISENDSSNGQREERSDKSEQRELEVTSMRSNHSRKVVTVIAPLPRAVLHESDGRSDNVDSTQPTAHDDNDHSVGSTVKDISQHENYSNAAEFPSSASVAPATVGDLNISSGGDTSDTLSIGAKTSSKKQISYAHWTLRGIYALLFGFLAVLLFSYFFRAYKVDVDLCVESLPKSTQEVVVEVLKPVFDLELLSHTSNLVQHLSALEDEALLLIDILDGTAAVEAEAELLQSKSDIERLDYHAGIDSSLNSFEELVSLLENETIADEEAMLVAKNDISDKLRLSKLGDGVEGPTALLLAALLNEEERVEIAVQQIDEEIVTAAAAASTAKLYGEAAASESIAMENVILDPLDEVVNSAMSSAEAALTSLETQIIKSVDDIDNTVREHLSILVDETLSMTAAAEAAAVAAALAAEALPEIKDDDELVQITNSEADPNDNVASASASASNTHTALERESRIRDFNHLQYLELDYAVWPRGGRVIPPGETASLFGENIVLTSSPYVLSLGPLNRLRYQLHLNREASDESVLISHSSGANERGEKARYSCYAFAGSAGSATVTMHSPVRVSAVQIAHRPRPSGKGGYSSAPKQIKLIGWPEVPSSTSQTEGIDLGVFTYEIPEDNVDNDGLQTFHLLSKDSTLLDGNKKVLSIPPLKAVTVLILSNYGALDYSSICRIKVLGQLETVSL